MSEYIVIGTIIAAFAVAAVLSYFFTPPVKNFAHKVGAIDVPKDARRMHKKPIPRLGGLAIYGGFLCSILIFGQLDETMLCVLLGAAIIVALGIFDDVLALGAKLKFVVQIVAAAIPVCIGDLQIGLFTNLNPLSDTPFVHLGILAVPVTIIWIVGITNAVNLIDGLDGLAVGVSSIAAITMLAVALLTGNMPIAITMAALAGACIGFMPYNLNPAKIFMGDTGSTFLGYMLATVSIMGLFKFYAVISFAVPFLILGLPIFDTANAIIRRVAAGRSPMSPDRGHVHHKLIDMGFNQKQAVAILYAISATLGLTAVVLTSSGEVKAIVLLLAVLLLPPLLVRLPALLRALLGTRRKVLFIVASEVVYGRFVDFDGSPGHVLDVLYDHFVVGMLLIVFVALGTHVAGQIVHRSGHGPPVGTPGQRPDHPLDVFAVMLVGDPPLRIGHRTGRNGQFLPRGTRVGTVHIQLEIRHDEQMVPEFVGEVRRVAQQRVQVAHDGDDGPRLTVAFAPVLYLQQRVDHLLDMAPVFGQVHLASRGIVILLHIAVSVPHTVPFGPPEPPAGPSR